MCPRTPRYPLLNWYPPLFRPTLRPCFTIQQMTGTVTKNKNIASMDPMASGYATLSISRLSSSVGRYGALLFWALEDLEALTSDLKMAQHERQICGMKQLVNQRELSATLSKHKWPWPCDLDLTFQLLKFIDRGILRAQHYGQRWRWYCATAHFWLWGPWPWPALDLKMTPWWNLWTFEL